MTATFYAQALEAAAASFEQGNRDLAITQLVHSAWLAKCVNEVVPKSEADRLKHKVLAAAGLETGEAA